MELYNGLDFLWGWRFSQVAESAEGLSSLKPDEYGAIVDGSKITSIYKGSTQGIIEVTQYDILQDIEILEPSETDYENVGWLEWDEASGKFKMKLKFGALAEAYYYFEKITLADKADGIYVSPNFRIYGSSQALSGSRKYQLLFTSNGLKLERSGNNIIISKEWGTF